jgi:hypothetical protein
MMVILFSFICSPFRRQHFSLPDALQSWQSRAAGLRSVQI